MTHAAPRRPAGAARHVPRRWRSDPMIEHLPSLGVTAVELLPVHQFVVDRAPASSAASRTTGATTRSASSRPTCATRRGGLGKQVDEFKTMVKTLHRAGIEVILDVVYNHTGEGNHLGPDALAARHRQRGLLPARARRTRATTSDFTGTGNSLNMLHPRTIQLIMDSLRYWVHEMHVDGFRFDLAPVLARELYEVEPPGDVLRHHPAGPDALAGEADRRAVGRRARAATRSATSRSAGRSGTASTATACAGSGAATPGQLAGARVARSSGSSDLYAGERPRAPTRASTSSPRTTASRCTTSSATSRSTTRRTARTTATAPTTTSAATGASKGRPTIRVIDDARERMKRNFIATLRFSQGVPMLLARRRDRPHAARQQQRLLPGQRDHAGSTGSSTPSEREPARVHAHACSRSSARNPVLRRRSFFRGRPAGRRRAARTSPGSARDGAGDDRRRTGATRRRTCSAC